MRRRDQFPFRHFDRPKPPVRCGPILVTGANYSSGSLDPFDILSPNDCCLRTADVRGVDFECALSAPLAHRSDAAQVFRAAVSAKVSGDWGFAVNWLSPSSVEIGRQGRVAAVGEHASDLLRQDAF